MSLVTKLIKQEYSELCEYKVDQNIQSTKKVLNFMRGVKKKLQFMDIENIVEPNIFLPNAENENFEKFGKIIKTVKEDCESQSYIPESKIQLELSHIMEPAMHAFIYTDDFSEETYLNSHPMNFLIVSKPNVGEVELAKTVADFYKCLLITPEQLIFDEISSDSRAGKCINFNLKNGRAIPAEVFYYLLERRIHSLTAQHRGYVVAGFPLIPNSYFKEDPISSESAIFNVQEIFEELTNMSVKESVSTMKGSKISMEEGEEEEEEEEVLEEQAPTKKPRSQKSKFRLPSKDLGPEKGPFGQFETQATLENQLKYIFSIFVQPYILIYISIENLDVINKVTNYRFDLVAEQEIKDLPIEGLPEFSPDGLHTEYDDIEVIDYKTNVRLPIHFEGSLRDQLKEYKYTVLPTVNRTALAHDIQYFLKVDGRLTPYKMFSSIYPRLRSLGIQPALVPQLMNENEMEGEFMGEQKPVFANLDEAFQKLRLQNIPNKMFKLQLSNWGYKCPVAFKHRLVIDGKAENAIRFMNKIFFLSDENAVKEFYRNPRRFLLPIKPKPVFKIFVIGPQLAGTTVVARSLANIFGLAYINPRQIEEEYRHQKNNLYLDSLRSAAIVEAVEKLTEERIQERLEKINLWQKNIIGMLAIEFPELNYRDLLQGSGEPDKKASNTEMKSVVSIMSDPTKADLDNELRELGLPLDNMKELQNLLDHPEKLLEFLPEELKRPAKPPNIYDQVVTDYVEEVLSSVELPTYDLSPAEIYDMIQQALATVDRDFYEKCGWIIDGFDPDIEIFKYFTPMELPNEVIYINETDLERPVLKERYENPQFYATREIFEFLRNSSATRPGSLDSHEIGRLTMSAVTVRETTVQELYPDMSAFLEYLNDYGHRWEDFLPYLKGKCPHPPLEIEVEEKTTMEILHEIIKILENRYRQHAAIFTDAEKEEEKKDFGGMGSPFEEGGEGGEGEGENLFEDNRRLGDTNKYCPVAFGKHFVLWKGKDQFAVKFQEKIYFLSTQEAQAKFLLDPYKFAFNHPPFVIPPMRVIVLGAIGTGKTTYGQMLARHFGLFNFNFDKQLLDYLNLDSSKNLEEFLGMTEPKEVEIIQKYLNEEYLPEYILDSIIKNLWTRSPYKETGVLIENFPRKNSDLLYLLNNYLIPDVVVEINLGFNEVSDRILQKKLNSWKLETELEKKQWEEAFQKKLESWEKEYDLKVERLLDVLFDQRREQFLHSIPPNPPPGSPIDSVTNLEKGEEEFLEEEAQKSFIYEEKQRNEDLEIAQKRLLVEFPKPADDKIWETDEDALARYEELINTSYNLAQEDLNNIRGIFLFENVDHKVYQNNEPQDKLGLRIIKDLEGYKFRNRSIFERVYSVSVDTAERLLEQGYYFLSQFGKTCPVQIYEKNNPFQMYLQNENQMTLFPVIHRRNIYFLCGEKALRSFKNDPLKYIENMDYKFPVIPFKVAIIGPERTGKTVLAEKLEKTLGLQVVTRGKAVRYVMKNLRNSELAKNMKKVLDKGWSLTEEMLANAVRAAVLTPQCIALGYTLVCFPNSRMEMHYLEDCDILPFIFIELQTVWPITEVQCAEIAKGKLALYSYEFLEHRHKQFIQEHMDLKKYLFEKFQNVYELKEDNRWRIFDMAKKEIGRRHFEVIGYVKNKDYSVALPLRYLLVTPEEFWEKKGEYLHYCPVCLYYNNVLKHGGDVVDRNGLVQFRQSYFWICDDHYNEFLKTPQDFLPPNNENQLPEQLPAPLPPTYYNYWEDGLCFICFRQHKKLIYGDADYAVSYNSRVYLFCSSEHQKLFLQEPHLYANLLINFRNKKPLILKELPTLGYLEQTTASLLTQVIVEVERIRPVHPCMSIETSALIYMAILLKYRNPKLRSEFVELYKKGLDKYKERCREIKKLLEISKMVR